MVDGDPNSSDVVTHTRYAEIQEDGSTIIKQVLVSMDSLTTKTRTKPLQLRPNEDTHAGEDYNHEDIPNLSRPQTPEPRKSRVSVIFL
jgi:hypothetical protein